eukprot:TRINITY_DN3564_c0_g1_i2.p1 TRINITY_DN3564_c0_g1~~TRINITY_DN3564_c0_g1_i2.p1  ORF type:complete len:190 (-),score=41.43 TRINITY_DN3564_c0_g1_i2:71-640(-)
MTAIPASIKLVVVGDGAVGKTCLLVTYAKGEFPTGYTPTVFDNYVVTLLVGPQQQVELGLWDTAGQEEYDRLRPLSYSGASVFLICFAADNRISYDNVRAKWFPEVTHFCPAVPRILVCTKCDMRAKAMQKGGDAVSAEEGRQLAHTIRAANYFDCSAKTKENLKAVFDEAVRAVIRLPDRRRKRCVVM